VLRRELKRSLKKQKQKLKSPNFSPTESPVSRGELIDISLTLSKAQPISANFYKCLQIVNYGSVLAVLLLMEKRHVLGVIHANNDIGSDAIWKFGRM
jgi:hypothetical protein